MACRVDFLCKCIRWLAGLALSVGLYIFVALVYAPACRWRFSFYCYEGRRPSFYPLDLAAVVCLVSGVFGGLRLRVRCLPLWREGVRCLPLRQGWAAGLLLPVSSSSASISCEGCSGVRLMVGLRFRRPSSSVGLVVCDFCSSFLALLLYR